MQRESDTGYRCHPAPLLLCCQWCGFWCFVLKVCTKTAGKTLIYFGAVKCSVTCLVGFSSTCWICVSWWTVLARERHGWVNEIVYSSVPKLSNNDFCLYCWCCLDMKLQYCVGRNATKKRQLRNSVESFLPRAADAPSKFDSLHFRVQVSIQNLLVFFGSYFSPCLSCPYQAGVEFSLWVVLEGSAISWWSSLVTSFTGSCPLGGIDANCVVCEFSMQMVRSNKLEFREILFSLHTLVLNCGKWNNVPVSAWWELIENVATTASFQL